MDIIVHNLYASEIMSMTFTKLFSSLTESTVWMEPDETRLVWITMLAMADKKGRVWGSIPGIANRARVSVDGTREAIAKFLSPDPDSRSKTFEGRRIEEIDGGWRLLNHAKYRAIRDEEDRREYKREHEAKRRAAKQTPEPRQPRTRKRAAPNPTLGARPSTMTDEEAEQIRKKLAAKKKGAASVR